VKKVLEKPVEYYCKTADDYYKRMSRPNALLHKPFSSLVEAANAMAKLGPLLEGLHLGKTMTVLDFGAGTCWLSRYLATLGCRTICLDVSNTALQLGKRLFQAWPSLDEPIEPPQFLPFDGRHIDLPDSSVDRIICFEALHHVPNVREVLSEMYRVLAPGGIAGFAEPGEHHSQAPASQAEMLNYDVLELDIVIGDIWEAARHLGFSDIRFRLYSYPTVDMSFEERKALVRGRIPAHVTGHIVESMSQWSIFFLHKGKLVLDSRGTVGLRGEVHLLSKRMTVNSGQPFEIKVRCVNTGEAVWLGPDAYKNIGSVKLGPHLYDANMRLIEFELRRHNLRRILPGERLEASVLIDPLPSGNYILTVDLVAEFVAWFEVLGAVPPRLEVTVV
jgi:ubiquinone/menaquinone biosynthesis C-methylase UbiE